MRVRAIRSGVAALLLAAPFAVLASATSLANAETPPQTGCPAGYLTLSVAWLATQGPYQAPSKIDAAGNQDGFVCGHPLTPADTAHICSPCAVPVVYLFRDNDLTPAF
jgi:hypothetical protein